MPDPSLESSAASDDTWGALSTEQKHRFAHCRIPMSCSNNQTSPLLDQSIRTAIDTLVLRSTQVTAGTQHHCAEGMASAPETKTILLELPYQLEAEEHAPAMAAFAARAVSAAVAPAVLLFGVLLCPVLALPLTASGRFRFDTRCEQLFHCGTTSDSLSKSRANGLAKRCF